MQDCGTTYRYIFSQRLFEVVVLFKQLAITLIHFLKVWSSPVSIMFCSAIFKGYFLTPLGRCEIFEIIKKNIYRSFIITVP